jgi:YggT family protein
MAIQSIMRGLSAVLTIYMILIFIRILLTWFQGPYLGRPVEILAAITDPYLQYFRRFRFLRTDRFDFSPLVALIVLVIVANIFDTIGRYGTITLGIILSLVVSAVWAGASFLLLFFLILMVARLVSLFFNASSVSPIWRAIDTILEPLLHRATQAVAKNRLVPYQTALAVGSAVVLAMRLLGGFLLRELAVALQMLPV